MIIRLALILSTALFSVSAFATSFDIIGIENFRNASSARNASASHIAIETGNERARVANLTGASGTLVNGLLNVTLTSSSNTFTLTSTNPFAFNGATATSNANAYQQTNVVDAILTVGSSFTVPNSPRTPSLNGLVAPAGAYTIRYQPNFFGNGDITDPLGPNTFGPNPDGSGTFLLTLWGATNSGPGGYIPPFDLDTDIRLLLTPSTVSPVPLPASVFLFGSALAGLFSIRKFKAA